MDGKDIIKLAADFAAGGIAADQIQDQFGEGVLSSVLSIAGGIGAGFATNALLELLDDHTGAVSGAGSVIDDGIDLVGGAVKGVFGGWF